MSKPVYMVIDDWGEYSDASYEVVGLYWSKDEAQAVSDDVENRRKGCDSPQNSEVVLMVVK